MFLKNKLAWTWGTIAVFLNSACGDGDSSPQMGDDFDGSGDGDDTETTEMNEPENSTGGTEGDGGVRPAGTGGDLTTSGGSTATGGRPEGTGGSNTVPPGHLPTQCNQPKSGEIFCVENGNGKPGGVVTLPYYFFYSPPFDGLASGVGTISLPDGFSLVNEIETGPVLCGHQRMIGTAIDILHNPIDYHWQNGTDCPIVGTDPLIHYLEIAIDESVAPGDYSLAIPTSVMSGAEGGAPIIPPGSHTTMPGAIRVLPD